jgi:hypothetical protein
MPSDSNKTDASLPQPRTAIVLIHLQPPQQFHLLSNNAHTRRLGRHPLGHGQLRSRRENNGFLISQRVSYTSMRRPAVPLAEKRRPSTRAASWGGGRLVRTFFEAALPSARVVQRRNEKVPRGVTRSSLQIFADFVPRSAMPAPQSVGSTSTITASVAPKRASGARKSAGG